MTIYELNYLAMIGAALSVAVLMALALLWVTDPDRGLPKERREYYDKH